MNIERMNLEAQNKYMRYIVAQIARLEEYTKLIRDGALDLQALNYAIATYTDVMLSLTYEYNRIKNLVISATMYYEVWEQEQFIIAKEKILSKGSSKAISQKEIQAQLVVDNKEEYMEKQSELKDLEAQQRAVLRFIDIYKKYDNILITLSNNTRAEMKSLRVAPICNSIENSVPISRRDK